MTKHRTIGDALRRGMKLTTLKLRVKAARARAMSIRADHIVERATAHY